VDPRTFDAYELTPAAFADDWHDQPAPVDLHAVVKEFFRPGRTADIGCGSGRDTAWLNENGYPAIGYDASPGLLAEARSRHPGIEFHESTLPELLELADGSFENVLCETVIMHLAPSDIPASINRMLAILEPGGTLYLSWRVTRAADLRDDLGRLYSAFDASIVTDALAGNDILHDAESTSASSRKTIRRVIARTPS
jgi:SAM-dependent methyltransferase